MNYNEWRDCTHSRCKVRAKTSLLERILIWLQSAIIWFVQKTYDVIVARNPCRHILPIWDKETKDGQENEQKLFVMGTLVGTVKTLVKLGKC